jgi:hypothetical protein
MSQLLERTRTRRAFARVDILSEFGETICLPSVETPAPVSRHVPAPQSTLIAAPPRIVDEEPERWDGLS